MKSEYKAKWVEALRSGKYKQGQAALRTNEDSFCCLGVLCDVVKEEVGIEWEERTDSGRYTRFWYFGGRCDFLPDEVRDLVGLETENPIVHSDRFRKGVGLSSLNDTFGTDFAAMADLIERSL